MADTVVKTVEIRESGAQRVYDRLQNLARGAEAAAKSVNDLGEATETNARKATSAARSYDRYAERVTGSGRAMREYARDLKAVSDAHSSGLIDARQYASELQRVRDSLQNQKLSLVVDQSGINRLLGVRDAVDSISNSARESARAFEQAEREAAAYAQQINAFRSANFGAQFNQRIGIGISAADAGATVSALMKQEKAAQEAERATAELAREIEQLRLAYDPAYASAQRMGQEIENLARLERRGIAILGGYDAALDKIVLKYDETAQAARRAADAQQQMIQSARADQAAVTSQISYNDVLGVRTGPRNRAQDSAIVFKEQIEAAEAFEKRLASIKAEIDPAAAAQNRYNAEIAEYVALNKQGHLTNEQLAQGLQTAETRLFHAQRSMNMFNDASKLSATDLQNLQFQLNDIAVSLASGQSPFTVMLQQGAQIGQLFGPGSTVMSALKAVGGGVMSFLTSPINLAILGFAAAATAVVSFSSLFKRNVEPLADVIDRQKDSVERLAEAYGEAALASEDYGRRSTAATEFSVASQLEKDRKRLQSEAKQLMDTFQDISVIFDGAGNRTEVARPLFKELAPALVEFRRSLNAGEPDIRAFDEALSRIGVETKDKELRKLIQTSDQTRESLVDLQGATEGTAKAMDSAVRAAAGMRQNLQETLDALGDFGADTRTEVEQIQALFEEGLFSAQSPAAFEALRRAREAALQPIRDDAKSQLDEARSQRALVGLSDEEQAIGEINAKYDEQIERVRGLASAERDLNAARAVEIETVREEALIERQKELQKLQEDAIKKAREEAEEWRKASQARVDGVQDQINSLRLEYETLNMSAGAAAEYRANVELLAAAKRAAAEAGMVVTPEEEQFIREAASAIGAYTEELEAARNAKERLKEIGDFESDLLFERAQTGRSAIDQQIASRLRSFDIDIDSDIGRNYANYMRETAAMADARTQAEQRAQGEMINTRDLMKDLAGEMIQGFGEGENAIDGVLNALASLNTKLMNMGLEKLFGGIFGTGSAQTSGGGGFFSQLGALAGQAGNFTAPSVSSPDFGRAASSVLRAPLADLKDASFDLAEGIELSAKSLGVSARDIATIISYETGGTFDPLKRGPTTQWGQHRGLIQFGEPQAARFGVDFTNAAKALATQLGPNGALVRYMRNSGVRPGMGLLDLYSAVNAGYVGRYDASDANNGGAWGTVRDKVQYQMAGHIKNASALLGPQDMVSAVSQGTIDANRRMVAGEVPGIDAWGGLRSVTSGAQMQGPQSTGPMGVTLPSNSVGGFLQSPVGQTALGGIAAFAGGMQSGSPVMGGLSGALSGFASGGPVGAIVGGISGLLGGLFGKSKAKKEAEKQAREQAEAAWKQNRPALNELTNEINRVAEGEMSERFRKIQEQLDQFKDLAAKTKSGKNEQEIRDLIANFEDYKNLYVDLFRDSLPGVVQELAAGFGLDNDFTKARDAILKFSDDFRGYLADVQLAYKVPTEQFDMIMATFNADKRRIEAQLAGGLNGVNAYGKTYLEVEAMKEDPRTRSMASILYAGSTYVDPKTGEPAAPLTGAQREELEKELADLKAQKDKEVAEYNARVADLVAERDKALKAAQDAAIEGLTRMISGDIEEPTAIAKALKQSEGAAVGARLAFADLGLTVEDATARIEAAQAKRRELLAEDFTDSLTADIRAADGFGFVNDFKSLVEEMTDTLADAASLGVDSSIVTERFSAAAQDIVDGALVTSDAFDDLITKFPELADLTLDFSRVLEEYSDRVFAAQNDTSMLAGALAEFDRNAAREIEDLAGQSASKIIAAEEALAAERLKVIVDFAKQAAERERGYADRLFEAANDNSTLSGAMAEFERRAAQEREAQFDQTGAASPMLEAALAAEKVQVIEGLLVSARQDEIDEIEGTISRLESLKEEWADLRKRLKLDDNLSPLGQYDQFLEAQKQFRDLSAAALAGDEDAQEKLAGISQDYLDEARAYYASSEDYYAVFNEVQGTLENAEKMAGSQLSAAQKQLELEKAQLDAMTGVKDSIESLQSALAAAIAAATAAKAALPGAGGAGGAGGGGSGGIPTTNFDAFLSQQYQDILGRAPDAAGAAFWTQARQNGATYADIITGIQKSSEIKKFAGGGLIVGPGTGTSDDVPIQASNGEFMMRHAAVKTYGLSTMNAMNEGRLSLPALPTMPVPANDGGMATLVRILQADNREMRKEIGRLGDIIAGSDEATRETIREGNRSAKTSAKAAERLGRAA